MRVRVIAGEMAPRVAEKGQERTPSFRRADAEQSAKLRRSGH